MTIWTTFYRGGSRMMKWTIAPSAGRISASGIENITAASADGSSVRHAPRIGLRSLVSLLCGRQILIDDRRRCSFLPVRLFRRWRI